MKRYIVVIGAIAAIAPLASAHAAKDCRDEPFFVEKLVNSEVYYGCTLPPAFNRQTAELPLGAEGPMKSEQTATGVRAGKGLTPEQWNAIGSTYTH